MKLLLENWNQYLSVLEEKQKAEESGKEFSITLPKLRISEQWGTPGSEDRKIIEMFTSKIQGSTLDEKIISLNAFISDCDKACAETKDVSEILGSLVFLDALASIIHDFNATTAGFLFESLMSALVAGEQIATGGQGIYQDTTDMMDSRGRPMSLKFYKASGGMPTGYVKAAVSNLKSAILSHGVAMNYLLGLKNTQGGKIHSVDFYEVAVGYQSEGIEGHFDIKDIAQGGIPMSLIVRGGRFVEDRDGDGHTLPGDYQEGKYFIGSLRLGSREDLVKIAENYASRLGSVLLEIYEQLADLSHNVNSYFLENDKEKALEAQQNAQTLKDETEHLL